MNCQRAWIAIAIGMLCLVLGANARAQSTFAVTGVGGAFPTSTSGINGAYPHLNQTATPSLPPNSFASTVVVPANAARITAVVLHGLRHTWSGDAHFILEDPSGVRSMVPASSCPR